MNNNDLTKFIYGYETDPKKTPFGLLSNQIRPDALVFNAGWFNQNGERLGRGDISLSDLKQIFKHINYENTCFFVLSETDTIWNMPENIDKTAPGLDYVLKNTIYCVKDKIYKVSKAKSDIKDYTFISRSELKSIFSAKETLKEEIKTISPADIDKVINALVGNVKTTKVKSTGKTLGITATKPSP